LRLTSEGMLRSVIRRGGSEQDIQQALMDAVRNKPKGIRWRSGSRIKVRIVTDGCRVLVGEGRASRSEIAGKGS
jgi:hypothetical protein